MSTLRRPANESTSAIFLWRDFNDRPWASHGFGRLSSRAVTQQFYVGLDLFVFAVYMCISQCLSDGFIVTVYDGQEHTFPSRRFSLSGPSSFSIGVCSSVCAHTNTEEGPERLKHLDGNVCSCPPYIEQ